MEKGNSKKTLSMLLVAFVMLAMVPMLATPVKGATEEEIENAIANGLAYLAGQQFYDGSWGPWVGHMDCPAHTGLVLLKLEDRAYELCYDSPFDPAYAYSSNVTKGWEYLFAVDEHGNPIHAKKQAISNQDHTGGASGTVDNPDTNGNGYGIYFDGIHAVYETGIILMALVDSGRPNRLNDGGIDYDGDGNVDTFKEIAQDIVDWLAYAQGDLGNDEGGYDYTALNNAGGWTDNSNAGYAYLGLAAAEATTARHAPKAEAFACTVPVWVKTELGTWITTIQDPQGPIGDQKDGGSWYNPDLPGNPMCNELKGGNLIFEMTFYGDTLGVARFDNAIDYIERHWKDPNLDPGWGFGQNPANYQAMFCLMKGFEYSGIDLIDLDGDTIPEHDWFAEFATVLVNQQSAVDGSWTSHGYGSTVLERKILGTVWALFTLEKTAPQPVRTIDKKVYVELLKNGDFSSGLDCWKVRVEKGHEVRTYDGPTWLAIRPLPPGWTDIKLVNEPGRTNVLDIIQTVSDGDGDWTGAIQTLNRDVSGFSELYFEADGKAMFQSLAGDGWVGGEYPVHFVITYTDVNGVDHDAHVGYPPNPAWQQGFYYLAGNLPNDPYSNLVTQNVWFHYKSPNLMNLSPAPQTIKTVRLYSSGWAYHGRIDNAQLYGTPPSAELGDVIHIKMDVTVPSGETVTVVDTLPSDVSYLTGTFTVDGVPATPTITKIGPPPPAFHEISYTIIESGTHMIELDCKVDTAYWEDRAVCNVATATWYDEAGEVIETKEDVECFTIHPFEELHKNVGIPKADVVFAIDLTGSMAGEIAQVKANATYIMNTLATQIADVQFGLISFMDYNGTYSTTAPGSVPLTYTALYGSVAHGDYPYNLDQDITNNIPVMTAAINNLVIGWGADGPQDYTRIIREAYNDTNLHWRDGAKRILILFGDDVPHDTNFDNNNDGILENTGGDPGRDTILGTSDDLDFETEVANAAANNVHIMAVYSGWVGQKFPWTYMADQTGGGYFELEEAEQIPDAIQELIKKQAEETLTIKEKTEVQWAVVMDVTNPFCYTMKNVSIKDNFGAELEIDGVVTAPDTNCDGVVNVIDLSKVAMDYGTFAIEEQDRWDPAADINNDGFVDMRDLVAVASKLGLTLWTTGRSEKVHLYWYIGDLDPGETARIIILVSTDLNPAGHQEYTEPEIYEMNSGATLKFIDPEQHMQLSAVTDSIYVTVLPEDDC